ncbi:MAG: glycosyltransferase [Pseudomonadota bacterium]
MTLTLPSQGKTASLKLGIIAGDPSRYSETFVRKHISELSQGRSVVVALCGIARPNITNVSLDARHPFEFINKVPLVRSRLRTERMKRFFRKNNVNVLLAEFGYAGIQSWKTAKELGIPIFCYFRGFDASQLLSDQHYVNQVNTMMPHLNGTFFVAHSLVKNLETFGVTVKSPVIIPSGTDTVRFSPSEKNPNAAISVGRFVPKKAPQITIESFARIAHKHPALHLEMIGDGPERAACEDMVASKGLGDRVTFSGILPHDTVRIRMARAGIYVQHFVKADDGDMEGMPSAVQEAMASGSAILATRHSGVTEHIHSGETGLLVDEFDIDGFSQNFDMLAGDAEEQLRLGQNARAYACDVLDYRKLYAKIEAQMLASVSA